VHYVYVIRDAAGRHYFGESNNPDVRLEQHRRGGTQTTRRMVPPLERIACRGFEDRPTALRIERRLKALKNPAKTVQWLRELP
jgi:putative endonuclease